MTWRAGACSRRGVANRPTGGMWPGSTRDLVHDPTCAWLGWAARRGVVARERILELVRWRVRGPLPDPELSVQSAGLREPIPLTELVAAWYPAPGGFRTPRGQTHDRPETVRSSSSTGRV